MTIKQKKAVAMLKAKFDDPNPVINTCNAGTIKVILYRNAEQLAAGVYYVTRYGKVKSAI